MTNDDKRGREMVESVELILTLKAKHGKKGIPKQTVNVTTECPRCGGPLDFTQSAYNGHTAGRCRKDGCLAWRE